MAAKVDTLGLCIAILEMSITGTFHFFTIELPPQTQDDKRHFDNPTSNPHEESEKTVVKWMIMNDNDDEEEEDIELPPSL